MTQEEKQLLVIDICARLPYGVKCYYNSPEIDDVPEGISVIKGFQNEGILVEIESGDVIDIDYVKPYLRPMSSITEREKEEFQYIAGGKILETQIVRSYLGLPYKLIGNIENWLNAHHFDYRGLIDKGLALEAPEGYV